MSRKRTRRPPAHSESTPSRDDGSAPVAALRIIGGRLARRRLEYSGDPRTRPMKDRVREAVFNLVGPTIAGKHAIDLFAGTGALGLEAISRGAARATLIERHFPTARLIERNAQALGIEELCRVAPANAFLWARRPTADRTTAWVVFCSPPYVFYDERAEEMLALIERMIDAAPPGSVLVVEADERWDFGRLPRADAWDVRAYPPAFVGVLRLPEATESAADSAPVE